MINVQAVGQTLTQEQVLVDNNDGLDSLYNVFVKCSFKYNF